MYTTALVQSNQTSNRTTYVPNTFDFEILFRAGVVLAAHTHGPQTASAQDCRDLHWRLHCNGTVSRQPLARLKLALSALASDKPRLKGPISANRHCRIASACAIEALGGLMLGTTCCVESIVASTARAGSTCDFFFFFLDRRT